MSNNENIIEKKEEKKVKGFLNGRMVKAITFTIISLCIMLSMFFSILAIWDFAKQDVLYRTLATLGVVCLGCVIFNIINAKYGD
jgi:uncharacterized membrane protein YqjE